MFFTMHDRIIISKKSLNYLSLQQMMIAGLTNQKKSMASWSTLSSKYLHGFILEKKQFLSIWLS